MSPKRIRIWGQPRACRDGRPRLSGPAKPGGWRPFFVGLAVLAIIPVAFPAEQPSKLAEDLPPGPMQAKATAACLECHEARIILQQRLSKAAWTKTIDKMVKWGAVVDPADRDALVDYLSSNFNPDQPPYKPVRSATAKASAAPKTK